VAGNSLWEGKDWILTKLKEINPRQIVDVGCGWGAYHSLAAGQLPGAVWIGIEAWAPYIDKFKLFARYEQVLVADVRYLNWAMVQPDVVILGDVIEHMDKRDAARVWRAALEHSDWVILSIPLGEFPQGALDSNPFEIHRSTWSHEECMDLPGIVDGVRGTRLGCYLARGREHQAGVH